MKNYSEITEKLKEIDWKPIADKAWSIIQEKSSKKLSNISEEDQGEYQNSLQEIAKLTIAHMTADIKDQEIIEREMGFVRLAMESMEARNDIFAYRQTVEVIGTVFAATLKVALAVI